MNIFHRTHFNKAPQFFTAWTGAGNAGILSVDYMRRKLNAHLFAQIDMSQFITPDSIVVNGGVARFPETPQSVFYHHHNPDMVFFESNAHAGGFSDIEVMRAILDMARELNCSRIFTAAALPQSMSHSSESKVLYACNNPLLVDELDRLGFSSMPDGVISGLNGLILGFAAARGIDAVCLLATIPAYAAGLTYPRAALAIIQSFEQLCGISVETTELESDIETADPMFAEIESKIKEFFSSSGIDSGEQADIPHDDDVPEYVMDRLERLFKAAEQDRTKAQDLKKELDKWGLYTFYEDRFLDLFENE